MSVNVPCFRAEYEDSVGHKFSLGLSVHRKLGAEAAMWAEWMALRSSSITVLETWDNAREQRWKEL